MPDNDLARNDKFRNSGNGLGCGIFCSFATLLASKVMTSKDYADFILEQLSGLDEITARKMMGEYILYYRDKIIGGIYDNRFLVKPTRSAREKMPDASLELPYDGAKPMLLVDNVENRDFLKELVLAMYAELPEPKNDKKKQS